MGELKPVGSEKLKGDAKIQRILDLTYYQSDKVLKESSEIVKEAKSGVYGIVKEKDGYYVKKGLNENSLDYIGGMFMKNKNKFSSYAEALKKMEFLTEQENLQEATKYVLKQPKSAPLAPAAEEPVALPPEDGSAALPGEEAPPAPEAEGDPNDFMSVLKKDAGELQQNLNKYTEQLESPDYAEIVNQVLSAIDFEAMEDSDKESILDQLGAEEVGDPAAEVPAEEVPPPPQEPAEMGETDEVSEFDGMAMDGVASIDELINTPLEGFEDDEDDALAGFDDEFLNDPEVKKAGRLAKSDIKKDEYQLYTGDDLKNPLDSDVNNVEDEASDDESLAELLDEPIDSNVNDVPLERSDDPGVVELDLDELTDAVNSSVKETLGKYFE